MKDNLKQIQDKLMNLPGDSIFAISVRNGAKENLDSCLDMIRSQAFDNYNIVQSIIGNKLLTEILSL